MKAFIYKKYGPPEVLQMIEREKPVPKDNEILLKIHATTVTKTETIFRQGKPYFSRLFTGFFKPKNTMLGEELSGVVEEVGNKVRSYKKGDSVFGTAGPKFGGNAEYICIPEDGVISLKPVNLTHEEAASVVDGFLTAMPFLRDTGKIKKGQKVLINGASGSVGSSAVQLAKYFETEVTGVSSSSNQELIKSLGADFVVDYTKEDFTASGEQYDLIFDAVGKITFSKSRRALKPNGVFLEAGVTLSAFGPVLWTSVFGSRKIRIAATGMRHPKERKKDLDLLKEMLEKGAIKPVIDRCYPFEELVMAHRYVDKGHKKGNVVISLSSFAGNSK